MISECPRKTGYQDKNNHGDFYSQMFLVPQEDGRQRSVINLKLIISEVS